MIFSFFFSLSFSSSVAREREREKISSLAFRRRRRRKRKRCFPRLFVSNCPSRKLVCFSLRLSRCVRRQCRAEEKESKHGPIAFCVGLFFSFFFLFFSIRAMFFNSQKSRHTHVVLPIRPLGALEHRIKLLWKHRQIMFEPCATLLAEFEHQRTQRSAVTETGKQCFEISLSRFAQFFGG